jgi:5-methylcytosine-specific restriction endonuclease McrA
MTDRHPFSTRKGRAVRIAQLRREPRCEACLSLGVITAATTVDHIIMLQDGGSPFDPANLRSLCDSHHKVRHGARPKVRIDAKTGLPLPGQDHPWSEQR